MSARTSSIAALDSMAPSATAQVRRLAKLAIATICSLVVFMTFTPFPTSGEINPEELAESGNILNQIGYLGVGGLALGALMTLADRRRLAFLIDWRWALLCAFLFLSALQSPGFDQALRGVILALFAMLITAGMVLLPDSEKDFRSALGTSVVLVLTASYGGVLLRPDLAIHAAGVEDHGGLWRGIYSHKNFAGPVMAGFTLFGLYMMRSGSRIAGFLVMVLSAWFVIQTGSKTTAGFLPLCILVVYARRIFASTGAVIAGHLAVVALVAVLTIGSAFSPRIEAVTAVAIEDTTFTGRDDIWRFGAQNLPGGLFGSYGYFSFWGTEIPLRHEVDPGAAWDVRSIVSGHTNFIDTVMNFGLVPAVLILMILLVLPAWQYRRACRRGEHRLLADFFMMCVTLMGMISSLETFIFARATPAWLILFLAVFGLCCLGSRRPPLWSRPPVHRSA